MDPVSAEPQAAVAIVCACTPVPSVLLMRRSVRDDDPWSGHWSFPGGHREPRDPDLVDTALRELEEECGIRLDRGRVQLVLPPVAARRNQGPFLLVAPFLFSVCEPPAATPDPLEVAGVRWIPTALLQDPAQHGLLPIPHYPQELLFPGIALRHHDMPLWGFTYRLITRWLNLVPDACGPEEAGFAFANAVLEHLLAHGVELQQTWKEDHRTSMGFHEIVRTARVRGTIPVQSVRERFAAPTGRIPRINLLEVRPDYVRVAGLDYEEYLISSVPF